MNKLLYCMLLASLSLIGCSTTYKKAPDTSGPWQIINPRGYIPPGTQVYMRSVGAGLTVADGQIVADPKPRVATNNIIVIEPANKIDLSHESSNSIKPVVEPIQYLPKTEQNLSHNIPKTSITPAYQSYINKEYVETKLANINSSDSKEEIYEAFKEDELKYEELKYEELKDGNTEQPPPFLRLSFKSESLSREQNTPSDNHIQQDITSPVEDK